MSPGRVERNGSLQKMHCIRMKGARGYGERENFRERWGKMGETDTTGTLKRKGASRKNPERSFSKSEAERSRESKRAREREPPGEGWGGQRSLFREVPRANPSSNPRNERNIRVL